MFRFRADAFLLLWLLLVVVACGGSPGEGSAGSEVPVFAEVVRFDTLIASSGEGYDLYDVRHARSLTDGRLLVLNTGTQEVLVFSPSGTLEGQFGGLGEGPGEFSHPWFLTTFAGDSILVTDRRPPQQSVVFTPEGQVARTFTLETPEDGSWYVLPRAITRNRRIIASQAINAAGPDATAGIRYVPLPLVVYDLNGQLLHNVSRPEIGTEYWLVEVEGQLRSTRPPLLERGLVAAGHSGIALADGDSPQVLWLTSDGNVRDTIRIPDTRSSPPSSVLDSVRTVWAEAETSEAGRIMRRRILTDLPEPVLPPTAGVEFDRVGRLWIARATATGGRDTTWWVYAGDSLLGRVELPAEIEIREIGPEHLIAVQTDSLGLETIMRLGLRVE